MALKVLHPPMAKSLANFGERIRLARLRRNMTMAITSERAGISRQTLSYIESGDHGVSMGSYLSVLKTLGLEKDINLMAADDALGRSLQDLRMNAPRLRASKRLSTMKPKD